MPTKVRRDSGMPPKLEKYLQPSRRALQWSVATSREDRLRWLLEFAAENLDDLSPDERAERCWRLEFCGTHPGTASCLPAADTWPMPDAELRRLQTEINRGLRIVLGEQRNEEWYAPGPARFALSRRTPRFKPGPKGAVTAPKRTAFNIRWDWANREGWILGGIAHLLQEAGSRLRGCAECGRAFLAVKRQIYCGEDCSQRKRNRAKQQ